MCRLPTYKFFGPHAGARYGRYELLDHLRAYKVRPAGDQPPDKFETGTKNHEGLAGLLVGRMFEGLTEIPGLTLYGITDRGDFDRRAPTIAFTLEGYTSRQVAERRGEAGIFVWDSSYYALAVTAGLGVEDRGGMVLQHSSRGRSAADCGQ